MLSKLIELVKNGKQIKEKISFGVGLVKKINTFIDRVDDDTDGDGVAQYQEVLTAAKTFEANCVDNFVDRLNELKAIFVLIKDWFIYVTKDQEAK